ncbi:phage tail spike protein, partial [Hathewaya histolytica]
MLQLYNLKHNKIAPLTKYKDARIERELNGDSTLYFSYPINKRYYDEIKEECYIRTKIDEFVVKEIHELDEWTEFKAVLNVEELEGNPFQHFESKEQTIKSCVTLALAGTPWTVGHCDVIKKRTVRKANCSTWEIIQEARKVYRCDITFDTLNKKVNIYNKLGSDKGTYFIEELNLKKLEIQRNSYDFCTRIIPIGKDGMNIKSVNGGKEYIENHQYSSKVITRYWEDNRYTVVSSLKEDAELKLKELSKPYRSYKADIIDLANLNSKYKNILDYSLGDTISLISKHKKVKEKQRIVKTVEWLDEPGSNTCEIANTMLRFEDLQKEFEDTTETVNNITTDNGTINGSKIDSIKTKQIEDFAVNTAKVVNLDVINANIENLSTGKADIQSLNAIKASIGDLRANKANIAQLDAQGAKIEDLYATKATIKDLEANTGKITVLESRAASIENLLAGNIGAENIKAGTITAASGIIADGAIGDAQISSLSATKLTAGVIDAAVITVKNLTADNIKAKSINGKVLEDGAIDNSKVADNANIAGSKLNINDVIVNINGATTQINGTKINVGDRTLDMELKTQKITTEENTKDIKEQKLQLNALDDALKIKIDKQDFNSFKSTAEGNISTINTNLSKATSDISMLQGQIKLKVGQSDIDNSINSIQVGGRNLILNSGNFKGLTGWEVTHGSISVIDDYLSWNCTEFSNWGAWLGNHSLKNRQFDVDEDYTISFEAKANKAQNIRIRICDRDGYNSVLNDSFDATENWKRYIYNFKSKEVGNERIVNFITPKVDPYVLDIRNIKLERGNKATDWTPAPEDIDQAINTIDTKINSSNSSIDLLKNQISAKVETSEFQSFKANINNEITNSKSKLSTTEQSINMLKGEISSKVSKTDIEKKIVEVSEKSKNLIFNSGNFKDLTGWATNSTGATMEIVKKNGYSVIHAKKSIRQPRLIPIEQNTDYIYSATIMCSTGMELTNITPLHFHVLREDLTFHASRNAVLLNEDTFVPANTWVKILVKFNSGEDASYFRTFIFGIQINEGINEYWIKNIKLEKGNKATDWTPAPEDVTIENTTKINSAESEIKQLSNQIRSKVDVNGVKSFIEQNPSSVKIGFNAITPNVNLSNSGTFEIINGALNVKNNNAEVVIDGKYNMHKILTSGVINTSMPVSNTIKERTVSVEHNLGYKPAFSAFSIVDGSGSMVPLPALAFTDNFSGTSIVGFNFIIRARADNTHLYIDMKRAADLVQTEYRVKIKYFI